MSAMDMIAKLVLDSADYESSLNEAVADTKKFKDETERTSGKLRQLEKDGGSVQTIIQKIGKSAGYSDKQILKLGTNVQSATKAIGAIGAAIGIAVGVFQLWKEKMSRCQEGIDLLEIRSRQFEAVTDGFYNGLNDGNIDGFKNKIRTIISKSEEAYKALSKVKNITIFGDPEIAELKAENERLAMIIDNESLDNETREQAKKDRKANVDSMKEIADDKAKRSYDAYIALVDEEAAKRGVTLTEKDKETYFSSYKNYEKGEEDYHKLTKKIDKLRGHKRTLDGRDVYWNKRDSWAIEGSEEYQKLKAIYNIPKDKLQEAFQYRTGAANIKEEQYGIEHEELMTRQGLEKDLQDRKKEEEAEAARIKAEAKRKEAAKKSQQPDLSKIKYNENGGIVIDIVPILDSQKSLPQLEGDLKRLKDQLSNAKTADEYVQIKAKVDEKEQQINDFKSGKPIKEQYQIDYENNLPNMNDLFADQNNAAIEFGNTVSEQYAKIQKDSEEAWEKMKTGAENTSIAVSGVGDMFSALGGAVGGSAGEMLEFAGQTAQAVAQMIPQIVSLIGAKQAEAMASGTASAAALPFPANIGAIASIIATIVGLFASFPKFANGGIISGPTSMGDYNLARVNGGEMILNQTQQGRLFRTLNQGGAIKSGPTSVEREWRIEGSTLVGVIKNYSAVQNKLGKKIF